MPSARVPVAPSSRLLRSVAVASALSCSAVVSAVLPGAVAAAAEEPATTVVGQLVQAWPDEEHAGTDGAHDGHGPLAWVETAAGDAVRIRAEDVAGITAGSTVEVTVGAEVDDVASTEDGFEPARTVLAADVIDAPVTVAALPDAAGLTNRVTVVLVTPLGAARDGVTERQVVAAVNGPVADFWAEQTGGAVRLGVTASRGWTSTAAGCSDPAALWNEVAGTVGFVPGPGRHLMLHVSGAAKNCSYALAEVGAGPSTGGRLYVRDTLPSLIAHEFGHNFGLGHSSAHQCEAAVETGTCRTAAYRDFYDVMGFSWAQLGSLNVAQAARLGVLPAAQQQTLTAHGGGTSLTLVPLTAPAGTRGLRLTDAEGVDYWLEYRTATGRDGWLSAPANGYRLQAGVLLRRAGALPDTSVLLDGTPAGAAASWDADLQAALPVGTAVSLSGGDFTVVVRSLSAAGAVLDVVPSGTPTPGSPAPVAPEVVPGTVMSGAGSGGDAGAAAGGGSAPAPAGEVAAPAAVPLAVPASEQVRTATPSLLAASQTSTSGWLAPAVGFLLAGSALLASVLLRRTPARRR